MNTQDLIKSLIQQCKIESMSTKDLVKELTELFDKIKELEDKNTTLQGLYESELRTNSKTREELIRYKQEFVLPYEKVKEMEQTLIKEKFKFDVEKEYKNREIYIYQEILRSLTCTTNRHEAYSAGSNGGYWNKGETSDKPQMPSFSHTIKFGDEHDKK